MIEHVYPALVIARQWP